MGVEGARRAPVVLEEKEELEDAPRRVDGDEHVATAAQRLLHQLEQLALALPSAVERELLARSTLPRLRELASAVAAGKGDSFEVGQRIHHGVHGGGVVAELLDDGVRLVQFDSGGVHRYRPESQHKLSAPEDLNKKFSQAGAYMLKHLSIADFFKGLEGRIGSPSPGSIDMVLETMKIEHTVGTTHGVEPRETFVTSNYGVTTSSAQEWTFVAGDEGPFLPSPDDFPAETKNCSLEIDGEVRNVMRTRMSLKELEAVMDVKNKELAKGEESLLIFPEVVGARLYTGPLFFKYNAVLRGLDSETEMLRDSMVELCCPKAVSDAYRAKKIGYDEAKASLNPYTTTLHVINSAIVKVGKLTYASTVYRGVSGGMLPREFWEKNEHGIRGGVEAGFMSTTQERAVAVGYASGKMQQSSIVIEIEQGMTSRGADISWLSQYPHEKEILFAPLTGIEVQQTRVVNNVVRRAAARTIDEQGLGLSATHIFGARHGLARRQRAPQRESERVDDRAGRLEAAEDARRSGARAPD